MRLTSTFQLSTQCLTSLKQIQTLSSSPSSWNSPIGPVRCLRKTFKDQVRILTNVTRHCNDPQFFISKIKLNGCFFYYRCSAPTVIYPQITPATTY